MYWGSSRLPSPLQTFNIVETRLWSASFSMAERSPILRWVAEVVDAGTGLRRLNFDKAERYRCHWRYTGYSSFCQRNLSSVKTVRGWWFTDGKGFAVVIRQSASSHAMPARCLNDSAKRAERIQRLSEIDTVWRSKGSVTNRFVDCQFERGVGAGMDASDQPCLFSWGLPNTRLREDPMVIHDLMHLPGF